MAGVVTVEQMSGAGIAAKAAEVMGEVAGTDYLWGGKTTDGFDCSGFVSYVLGKLMPNQATSYALTASGFASSSLFEAATAPAAGDLIYFAAAAGSPAHIGIVYDATSWIGSQSSTGVAKVKFSNLYWSRRSPAYYRLKALSPAAIQGGRAGHRTGATGSW